MLSYTACHLVSVAVSLSIGGCDGGRDQVIGCSCDPHVQAEMFALVMERVTKKEKCHIENIVEARERADYSCRVLGYT